MIALSVQPGALFVLVALFVVSRFTLTRDNGKAALVAVALMLVISNQSLVRGLVSGVDDQCRAAGQDGTCQVQIGPRLPHQEG